jgi:hypothetical protein
MNHIIKDFNVRFHKEKPRLRKKGKIREKGRRARSPQLLLWLTTIYNPYA